MSDIIFKPLLTTDLPLLHKWLNTSHVVEWYGKKTCTFDEVAKQYLPRITGQDPTKSFFVSYQRNPIGYIQSYLVKDDRELQKYVNPDTTAGLDMFIGEPNYLGRGLGSKIIKEFLKQVVFKQSGISACLVDPLPSNPRMIHVNEKIGFKYLTTTLGKEPKYLMIIHKEDVK